jgi:iron-sulfur cluster repair protein YtfE (RIC family)
MDQIRQEHEELRETLGKIHRTLGKREAAVAAVAEMLSLLGDDVETHFSDEETTGFFDNVLDRAPRLSDRIDALRSQHQELSATVESLQEVATSGDGSDDWWRRIETAFHDFSKELMHHEGSENELLLEAYTDDIGAAD